MKQRRWMSINEVFDQLEEAETAYMLQLWVREEREQREEQRRRRAVPSGRGPTAAARQRT